MNNSFEFTLHSPLTKEDWNKILDVEHENTTSVTFQTPQGKQVRYIKYDVLDKIKAEIEEELYNIIDDKDLELGKKYAFERVVEIIDKYKTESEDKE